MELEQFITATLSNIVRGVEASIKELEDSKAVIGANSYGPTKHYQPGRYAPSVQMVDFDVAVVVDEGKATKGGVGILVGPITLGTKGESNKRSTSESRIKFTVPVVLPAGDKGEPHKKLSLAAIQKP